MCGIGTSLVEAAQLGREAVGIKYEPRWADLARRNLAAAAARGARGDWDLLTGDARTPRCCCTAATAGASRCC